MEVREKEKAMKPDVQVESHLAQKRMTLSQLRARIRVGVYADDLYPFEAGRLLFLRWLIQQGLVNEWEAAEEAIAERPHTASKGRCAQEPGMTRRRAGSALVGEEGSCT